VNYTDEPSTNVNFKPGFEKFATLQMVPDDVMPNWLPNLAVAVGTAVDDGLRYLPGTK
jgi:hypothetical protein